MKKKTAGGQSYSRVFGGLQEKPGNKRSEVTREDFAKLRKKFDWKDHFINGGFEIKAIRRRSARKIPEWAMDDKALQRILLIAFPKLNDKGAEHGAIQRRRAGRWLVVIHRFYRMGYSYRDIAAEMRLSVPVVKNILQRIRRVATQEKDAAGRIRKGGKRRNLILSNPCDPLVWEAMESEFPDIRELVFELQVPLIGIPIFADVSEDGRK